MSMSKPLQILGISNLDLRSNAEKAIGEPKTCVADWLPSLSWKVSGATDPVSGPSLKDSQGALCDGKRGLELASMEADGRLHYQGEP
jgi:hypothetical protein